jgi:hypothetical protein
VIRALSVASLGALLVLVLYLPSAYPPDRFLAQMRAEHALNDGLWGHEPALRILGRALAVRPESRDATLSTANAAGTVPAPVDVALAAQISTTTARLFGNPYFRSAEALATLAIYRVSSLLEWLPVLLPFLAAALLDGAVGRTVKSKEFSHHDPETYGLSGLLLVLMFCVTSIAFVLPVTLHPYFVAATPVAVGLFGSIAIANFHARG